MTDIWAFFCEETLEVMFHHSEEQDGTTRMARAKIKVTYIFYALFLCHLW
jgi:hypothetical protein